MSWCPSGCGTVFKITPSGAFTIFYAFCPLPGSTPCMDGTGPLGGLLQATNGSFYGTTSEGGQANRGVIFKLAPTGTLTTLHSFCIQAFCPDGSSPISALTQSTDGNLYGTAPQGGNSSHPGTVFTLSTGLSPFVKTLQAAGNVGASVTVLGTDLTGATTVSFHGAPATFSVVSATEITAKVPAGATTGKIQVITPSGTLSSNTAFRVLP